MFKNSSAYSLVELMVVLAALAGVALIVTKLGKDSIEIQNESMITNDYNDLVREAHFLIGNERHCKVNFNGLTFELSPKVVKEKMAKLHLANPEKDVIGQLKFESGKKYKNLVLDEMFISIYPNINETYRAQGEYQTTAIVSIVPKKSTIQVETPVIEHSIYLNYKVSDDLKKAVILNCQSGVDQKVIAKVWCGTLKNPCGQSDLDIVGIGTYAKGLFSGTFEVTEQSIMTSEKICKSAVQYAADLKPCQ